MSVVIFTTLFGSRLYGTAHGDSDFDWKGVFIPAPTAILLQRVENAHVTKDPGNKSETEFLSLQRYLGLLAEGQTMALDMLFASATEHAHSDETWAEIWENRHRLLTRKVTGFVTYAQHQAAKYGIKGSRIAAVRLALGVLEQGANAHGPTTRLSQLADAIRPLVSLSAHMDVVTLRGAHDRMIEHWEVSGKKLPFTGTIENARGILQTALDLYGERARAAERNDGVDWKALMHAIRVAHEAVELLTTKTITFPRPEADLLLKIRSGTISFTAVSCMLEGLLDQVTEAAEQSDLPDEADLPWIDDFVARVYRDEVI